MDEDEKGGLAGRSDSELSGLCSWITLVDRTQGLKQGEAYYSGGGRPCDGAWLPRIGCVGAKRGQRR